MPFQGVTKKVRDLSLPREKRGGYFWTVGAPFGSHRDAPRGISGYLSGGELREGSNVRLRVEDANEHLPSYSRLSRIDGYYSDEYGIDTLRPAIARLPGGRGFLAGWTMGEGMVTSFDADVIETAEDAAMQAHDIAERAAEDERAYQASRCEECRENEREYDDTLCTVCRFRADHDIPAGAPLRYPEAVQPV